MKWSSSSYIWQHTWNNKISDLYPIHIYTYMCVVQWNHINFYNPKLLEYDYLISNILFSVIDCFVKVSVSLFSVCSHRKVFPPPPSLPPPPFILRGCAEWKKRSPPGTCVMYSVTACCVYLNLGEPCWYEGGRSNKKPYGIHSELTRGLNCSSSSPSSLTFR